MTGESGYDIQAYYAGQDGQQGGYGAFLYSIPSGSQLDFQVEALVGHNSTYWFPRDPVIGLAAGVISEPVVAYDSTSGWSPTQTVTILANSTSASTSPTPSSSTSTLTPTPTSTSVSLSSNSSLLLIALVVIAFLLAIVIFLLIYMRKRNPANSNQQPVSKGGM
jgi:hypothetical protein